MGSIWYIFTQLDDGVQIYSHIIIILMLKNPQIRPQPSFLQRFQGRNQKISRDGLLQILHAKRTANSELEQYASIDKQQKKSNRISLELIEQYPSKIMEAVEDKKQLKTPKAQKYKSQELKNNASVSYKLINQNPSKLKNPQNQRNYAQNSSKLKFPIIAKSKSQNHIFIPKLQMIESDRVARKKIKQSSYYSNRLQRQNQLDEYVLRHLKFLDKFQKQFLLNAASKPLLI